MRVNGVFTGPAQTPIKTEERITATHVATILTKVQYNTEICLSESGKHSLCEVGFTVLLIAVNVVHLRPNTRLDKATWWPHLKLPYA